MKKSMDQMKNKDLEPAVIEKHEGHGLRTYWRKLMDSAHNKVSRGSECICKSMTTPHEVNWRRTNGKPGHSTPGNKKKSRQN